MSPNNEDPRRQLEVLNVLDATLAGEPVAPAHAELAELAVLLADERPTIDKPPKGELQVIKRSGNGRQCSGSVCSTSR